MNRDLSPALVGALGEASFAPTLARHLHAICGADHFAAFLLESDEVIEVAACCVDPARTARNRVDSYLKQGWWRRDPALTQARGLIASPAAGGAGIVHVDFSDHAYAHLRPSVYPDVRDRLLLCAQGERGTIGLSVLRGTQQSLFGSDAMDRLHASAAFLVALLTKHAQVCRMPVDASQALASPQGIEHCIAATSTLPRRETQVCARIVYGMSSAGIALDLGVSEETVKTYRKRAYQRLGIGSERELLGWYLARWSGLGTGATAPARLH